MEGFGGGKRGMSVIKEIAGTYKINVLTNFLHLIRFNSRGVDMKKVVLITLLLAASTFAWGQGIPQLGVGVLSSNLVSQPKMSFFPEITAMSYQTERDLRDRLYAILFNLFIPGVGSFIIGDLTGGLIGFFSGVGGYVVLGFGIAASDREQDNATALLITGGVMLTGAMAFNIARPVQYVKSR